MKQCLKPFHYILITFNCSRVLNCGLKLQADGFGLDTEIGILSYLAFIQEEQLKSVLNEMVKVCSQIVDVVSIYTIYY